MYTRKPLILDILLCKMSLLMQKQLSYTFTRRASINFSIFKIRNKSTFNITKKKSFFFIRKEKKVFFVKSEVVDLI